MRKIFCALAMATVVSGCGGSSGDSHDPTHGVATLPPPPLIPKVIADVVYYSPKCLIERPINDARFVVHESNGNVLREEKTDSQGHLEVKWDGNESHLTSVLNPIDDDGSTTTLLDTELNLKKGDLGKIYVQNRLLDSQCDCRDFTVDFSEISAFYNSDYEFLVDGSSTTTGEYHNVTACKERGVFRPVSLTLSNRYSQGLPVFAAKVEFDDTQSDHRVVLTHDDLVQGDALNLDPEGILNNVGVTANTDFGNVYLDSRFNEAVIFDGLYENYYVNNAEYFSVDAGDSSSISFRSFQRIKVDDVTKTYFFSLPDNSQALIANTQQLLEALDSDVPATYDFSTLNRSYDKIYLRVAGDNSPTWRINAQVSGVFPSLSLPQDIEAQFEDAQNVSLYLSVTDYDLIKGGIDEWRSEAAKYSRIDSGKWTPYLENVTHERILIRQ
ncbi:hypothetical protein D5R81_03425 [Parashewanella spongiae]|uniref:Uncharacterized protein n=1 Tax=Parashewanella spongiae TaxID=342950 RepID=A0A3A6UIC2_9GAMM|nr:hypothetical protein [Parashewanella spongiae]MCL1077162.1 hypothetical protein [Parashewanella spongiae]RJY18815.1 hypothetical protein D5R81_03425 [Parashewanella spongiae]